MKIRSLLTMLIGLTFLNSCSDNKTADKPAGSSGDLTKEVYSILNLVKENKIIPDSVIRALNAQHHQLKVLERRTVPGPFKAPEMKFYTDYVAKVEDLPVINPGPGEYVHVMEGQRNGYNNLTIGITETFPNGAPPMHSHEG